MSVGRLAGPLAKATGTIAGVIVALLLCASPAAAAGPSVTINQAAGQSDPTSSSPIEFTVTFSASVTGFDYADVDLSSSTVGGTPIVAVSGSGKNYTVKVSGMTSNGTVVASIPAGAAQDAGNPSLASTSTDNSVTWSSKTPPPTVTIDQATGQSDPASGSTIQFTTTFSAPVSGFSASGVDLSASSATGPLTATVTGGPTVYTVTVSGMTGAGAVIASIKAAAALDAHNVSNLTSTSTDNSVYWHPAAVADAGSGGGDSRGGPLPVPGPIGAAPSLRLLSACSATRPCRTDKKGHKLPLRVACAAVAPCSGEATIVLHRKTLGKLKFMLAAGATATLKVPLRPTATRLLTSRPKLAAELDIQLGSASTASHLTFALPGGGGRR
jgi:hypothetical protein